MLPLDKFKYKGKNVDRDLSLFEMLKSEANTVRDKDKILIRNLFKNFYHKKLRVGIGVVMDSLHILH
jgi:hypothetical protein